MPFTPPNKPSPVFARCLALLVPVVLVFALTAIPAHADSPTRSPDLAQIGDIVWREGRLSYNGIQDGSETGLPYAPVNLYQAGLLISVTNASAIGAFGLDVSLPGIYTLEMPNPSYPGVGLVVSPQNQGGDDSLDSDISTTQRRATITVGTGNDSTIDGGVHDGPNGITYCTGRQLSVTDWTDTFSLPKADPSLGILTGVYIRSSVGSAQNATLTNTGAGSQTFTYQGGAIVSLTLPNATPLATQTARSVPGITLLGGAFALFEDIVDYRTSEYALELPDNLSAYIGDGGFNDFFPIPAQSQGISTFIGGGNLIASAQTRAYSTVCVTYVFQLPLSVVLNSFEAQCTPSAINVLWETADESQTLGFNLWRGTDPTTPSEQLNSELIPAQSPGGGGAFYEWADATVSDSGTYYYWLQDVDMQGNVATHGPVSAAYPCAPTAVALVTFDSAPTAPMTAAPFAMLAGLMVAAFLYRRRR